MLLEVDWRVTVTSHNIPVHDIPLRWETRSNTEFKLHIICTF